MKRFLSLSALLAVHLAVPAAASAQLPGAAEQERLAGEVLTFMKAHKNKTPQDSVSYRLLWPALSSANGNDTIAEAASACGGRITPSCRYFELAEAPIWNGFNKKITAASLRVDSLRPEAAYLEYLKYSARLLEINRALFGIEAQVAALHAFEEYRELVLSRVGL